MDPSNQKFFESLMATFREEAAEHLKVLSDGFLKLEKNPSSEEKQKLIETIFREAHSLKGAARAVNQQNILEICQALETILSLYNQAKIQISTAAFDVLHETIDTLNKALIEPLSPSIISNTITQLKAISNQSETPKEQSKKNSSEPEVLLPSSPNNTSNRKPLSTTIRISLEKINQFFQDAEETLMIKLVFKSQIEQIKGLYSKLYRQEKHLGHLLDGIQRLRRNFQKDQQAEEKGSLAHDAINFLEDRLQEIRITREETSVFLKNMEQNTHIIGSTIDKLLEDTKKILMQPMAILFETLPHMIRDISRDLSKEIHVEFQGKDIEVDRRVLEEIKDPIVHLIRNAIDHGIESPQERIKRNKTIFGTITITAIESEGNKIQLSIADDGCGIDVQKLKQVALQKGVISQKESETMSNEEAIQLAFHSDISTSPIITELSGRGYGLGIVSEKVDKLGGQIKVVSIPCQGTKFILTLPLTLATFRGIRVSVTGQDFILPTHYVKRVVRIKFKDIKKAENCETIVLEDHTFSFVHLANLLGIRKVDKPPNPNELLCVLIVKAAEQMIAFGADSIHSEQEVLVKRLGKQTMRIRNIMAATVSETGSVIPILNPVDLLKSAIKGDVSTSSWKTQENLPSRKSILLVEDSITTRLLLKNILTSAGYEVKTAIDGVEALEILHSQVFDLIVTDIEMPRMNGFELTKKVREMPKLKELPIVVCTALGSKEDREKGIELGANAYLDKSKFNQQTFTSVIKNLI